MEDTNTKEIDNVEESAQKPSSKFNVKIAIVIAVVLVVGALAYSMKSVLIAATVNGSPIYRLSVIKELEKDTGKQLLDALISEKLIKDEAKVKNISITNEELNTEIIIIESQIVAKGDTLENAMKTQKITMADLKRRILLQKYLEKLVTDKVIVTDADITEFIKTNKIAIPKGQDAAIKAQVKDSISKQKLSEEADKLVTELRTKAKVNYFVDY